MNNPEIYYDEIGYCSLIFELDYQALKHRIESFKKELIRKCFHPDRKQYYLNKYNYNIRNDLHEYLPQQLLIDAV